MCVYKLVELVRVSTLNHQEKYHSKVKPMSQYKIQILCIYIVVFDVFGKKIRSYAFTLQFLVLYNEIFLCFVYLKVNPRTTANQYIIFGKSHPWFVLICFLSSKICNTSGSTPICSTNVQENEMIITLLTLQFLGNCIGLEFCFHTLRYISPIDTLSPSSKTYPLWNHLFRKTDFTL